MTEIEWAEYLRICAEYDAATDEWAANPPYFGNYGE